MIQPLPVLIDGPTATSQSSGKQAQFPDAISDSDVAFPKALQDATVIPETDVPIIDNPTSDSRQNTSTSPDTESNDIPIDGQQMTVPVDAEDSGGADDLQNVASDVPIGLLPYVNLLPMNPAIEGKLVPMHAMAGQAQLVSNDAQGLPASTVRSPEQLVGMLDFARDSLPTTQRSLPQHVINYLSNLNIQHEISAAGTTKGVVNPPTGNQVTPSTHQPSSTLLPVSAQSIMEGETALPKWITDRIATSTGKQARLTQSSTHTPSVSSQSNPSHQSSNSGSRPVTNQLESESTKQIRGYGSTRDRVQGLRILHQVESLRISDQGTTGREFTPQKQKMPSDRSVLRNQEPVSTRNYPIRNFSGQNMNSDMQAAARAVQIDSGLRFESANTPLQQVTAGEPTLPVSMPSVTQVTAGRGENISWNESNATVAPLSQKVSSEESAFTQRVWRGLTTLLNQRGGVMNMRLEPPELGELRVQMSITQNHVTATFHAESTKAQALLERSLGMLRTALEQQGLTVDRLHVQHTPPNQSEQLREEANQEQDQNQTRHQQDAGDGRSRGRGDEEGTSSDTQTRAADDLFAELLQGYNPGDITE